MSIRVHFGGEQRFDIMWRFVSVGKRSEKLLGRGIVIGHSGFQVLCLSGFNQIIQHPAAQPLASCCLINSDLPDQQGAWVVWSKESGNKTSGCVLGRSDDAGISYLGTTADWYEEFDRAPRITVGRQILAYRFASATVDQ